MQDHKHQCVVLTTMTSMIIACTKGATLPGAGKNLTCAEPLLPPITFVLLGKALSKQTVMIMQQGDSISVQKDLCSTYVHTL